MRPLFIFFLKWRIRGRLGKKVPSKWVLSPGAIFCIVHKVKIRRKKNKNKEQKNPQNLQQIKIYPVFQQFFSAWKARAVEEAWGRGAFLLGLRRFSNL